MAIQGACHCGGSVFEIDAALPATVTSCTCSFCRKRGALWAYYAQPRVRIRSRTAEHSYRWRSGLIAHNFCGVCGCSTYSVSPDLDDAGRWDGDSVRIGVNARLIEGFDAAAARIEVLKMDGPGEGFPPLPPP